MDVVKDLLVFPHLVGMAAVVGGWWCATSPAWCP